MQDHNSILPPPKRTPWNKGKLIGAKPPLLARHVWSIRTKLQIERRRERQLTVPRSILFNRLVSPVRRISEHVRPVSGHLAVMTILARV
jgi:hypothetical protein